MRRRAIAVGALLYAVFVPFEALGGQFAEAAAWVIRFVGSKRGAAEPVANEPAQF